MSAMTSKLRGTLQRVPMVQAFPDIVALPNLFKELPITAESFGAGSCTSSNHVRKCGPTASPMHVSWRDWEEKSVFTNTRTKHAPTTDATRTHHAKKKLAAKNSHFFRKDTHFIRFLSFEIDKDQKRKQTRVPRTLLPTPPVFPLLSSVRLVSHSPLLSWFVFFPPLWLGSPFFPLHVFSLKSSSTPLPVDGFGRQTGRWGTVSGTFSK